MDWSRTSLTVKLFISYLLVVAVGSITLFVAADFAGPYLFTHAMMAFATPSPSARAATSHLLQQVQQLFTVTMLQTHLLAVAFATLAALAVSLFIARQVVRPLQAMLVATERIAAGHYAERVVVPAASWGDEIGQLAASFNAMAAALEQNERRRLELIADVAHELRTPIATLEGYLEGILDGVFEPSPALLGQLHDEAGRLHRLVDDLQELSRAEARQLSLSLQSVSPASIVHASIDRLRPLFADKGLTLTVTAPPDLPAVRADSDRVIQVLTNLLTNALRYTPQPGHVHVSVTRGRGTVEFSVQDSGIGFAPEQATHLFDRFYRADRSRARQLGGSGIGLTIARALVEGMGGQISAASEGPDKGSTFTFTLPAEG
ncbi:MAG: ATP-binding protein [Chloroflexi bacterium]|nr:ATP-binding protein [Chloroflexota bacterium]